jgi:death-on-curing protein
MPIDREDGVAPDGQAEVRTIAHVEQVAPWWRRLTHSAASRRLTGEQALRIARAAVGGPVEVRDLGLLDAAVHRPRASVLGHDAYPDLFTKAAALLHSLARNLPLVDGNKRLAWLATYVFCTKNGVELDPDDDAAYELVIAVASGSLEDVGEIAATLGSFAR